MPLTWGGRLVAIGSNTGHLDVLANKARFVISSARYHSRHSGKALTEGGLQLSTVPRRTLAHCSTKPLAAHSAKLGPTNACRHEKLLRRAVRRSAGQRVELTELRRADSAVGLLRNEDHERVHEAASVASVLLRVIAGRHRRLGRRRRRRPRGLLVGLCRLQSKDRVKVMRLSKA